MPHPINVDKVIQQMQKLATTAGATVTSEDILEYCRAQFAKYEQLLDSEEEIKGQVTPESSPAKQFEFWSSLLDSIQKYGRLTANQEAMVHRHMRRNIAAPSPTVGERILVNGEVVLAKGYTGSDGTIVVRLHVFDTQNREAMVSFWMGNKIYDKLNINAYVDRDGKVVVTEYPKRIAVVGTVDWVEPGCYRIKRPKIAEI